MLPAQPNKSLIDGIELLQMVVTADRPLGSREVGRMIGIEPTRANRLLGTLCHLGMLEKTAARKYIPGPALHVLSAQSLSGSGLLTKALPHLDSLWRQGKFIVAMGVLWRSNVCYLVHASPEREPGKSIGTHRPYPATKSIIGLALLSSMTDAKVRKLYEGTKPEGFGDIDELIAFLQQSRETGYAIRSLDVGKISLSAVIGSPAIASISVTGKFPQKDYKKIAKMLLQTANAINSCM